MAKKKTMKGVTGTCGGLFGLEWGPLNIILFIYNYEALHPYVWKFYFAPCPNFKDPNESKLLRILGEQTWRSKYGWPILCGK